MKTKQQQFLTLVLAAIGLLISSADCLGQLPSRTDISAIEGQTFRRLLDAEEDFKLRRSPGACIQIVANSYDLGITDKVITYGSECLKLGLNSKARFYINLWMASAFKKHGELQSATKHLEKALVLDSDKLIDAEYLKQFELDDLLAEKQRK